MMEEFEELSLKIKELKKELNLLNSMLIYKENIKKRKYKFVM